MRIVLGYKYLITIANREYSNEYEEFFKRHDILTVYDTLCNGTAGKKTLDYLGLEKTEKIMFFTVVTDFNEKRILSDLIYEMRIDIPGNGIALTIPIESVGGQSSLNNLTKGQNNSTEVSEMSQQEYSMIIVIAEKGCTELVMDAAKSAGARGGTVVHAKGTGDKEASKFFGVSIASEKDMIHIVTKLSDRDKIMQAIMDNAGSNTPAKSVLFSIPVGTVVGLRNLNEGTM